jgi:hypothetical protein
MSAGVGSQTEEVAGGRLATSAQPPRATRPPDTNASSQHTPHPIRTVVPFDTPGALRKGLRCFSALRPLPERILQKPGHTRRTS